MIIQIAQFLLGLSILIVLHELGHFIPAKLFGTRVEKFYLFFDYKFSLFKKKIGSTVYGIGWIPLGGYVKISGMVDESMDTEGLSKDPEPWEFRAKPAWQRLIILTGGVIVNFILAFVIYSGMMSYYGEQYLMTDDLKYGLNYTEGLHEAGLRDGDRILSIGGEKMERFSDISKSIIVGLGEEIRVQRGNEEFSITLVDSVIGKIIESERAPVELPMPYVIREVSDSNGVAAAQTDLMPGDSLVSLNGEPLFFYDQYTREVPKYRNDSIHVGYYRNGELRYAHMLLDSTGKMGIYVQPDITRYYNIVDTTYSGMSALSHGWDKAITQLDYYIRQFKVIFSPETGAVNQLGGFRTMMQQYEESSWNWERFWGVTAFISIMLGFLNILPIPALDGGHVLFTLIEMATGRRPSIKVLEYAQMVGFFLLLALLIFANGNDFGLWDIFK